MGIQINGSTDHITAIDGTIDFVSNIGNIGLITASRYELLDSITIGAGSTIIKTSNGQLLVGTNSNRAINAHAPRLQLSGTDYSTSTVSIINNAAAADGAYLFFSKQRSGSAGGSTAVAQDDIIGDIRFTAGDGTDIETGAARITVVAESNASSNSVPSYMRFSTTSTTTPV
tara:strand:+ start:59 stop:574 length:516 start_codon:yes stop_codon:yes gene_type:complete